MTPAEAAELERLLQQVRELEAGDSGDRSGDAPPPLFARPEQTHVPRPRSPQKPRGRPQYRRRAALSETALEFCCGPRGDLPRVPRPHGDSVASGLAAPPRVPRGDSVASRRGAAAGATWRFGGSRRGNGGARPHRRRPRARARARTSRRYPSSRIGKSARDYAKRQRKARDVERQQRDETAEAPPDAPLRRAEAVTGVAPRKRPPDVVTRVVLWPEYTRPCGNLARRSRDCYSLRERTTPAVDFCKKYIGVFVSRSLVCEGTRL